MQSYKQSLKESICRLESLKRERPLATAELEALQELYDKLDSHDTYLHEAGMSYESQ